jgi:hypothetical protein
MRERTDGRYRRPRAFPAAALRESFADIRPRYRPAPIPSNPNAGNGVTKGLSVGRDLGLDGVVDYFTLFGDEAS